jgi:hypothetical protein
LILARATSPASPSTPVEQFKGERHGLRVDLGVDLDEVARHEPDAHVERRQPIAEGCGGWAKRHDAVEPAWLQVELDPVALRKGRHGRAIRLGRLVQHPRHQRRGGLGDRHLELRQSLADAE